jgi:hypothetical protein
MRASKKIQKMTAFPVDLGTSSVENTDSIITLPEIDFIPWYSSS